MSALDMSAWGGEKRKIFLSGSHEIGGEGPGLGVPVATLRKQLVKILQVCFRAMLIGGEERGESL